MCMSIRDLVTVTPKSPTPTVLPYPCAVCSQEIERNPLSPCVPMATTYSFLAQRKLPSPAAGHGPTGHARTELLCRCSASALCPPVTSKSFSFEFPLFHPMIWRSDRAGPPPPTALSRSRRARSASCSTGDGVDRENGKAGARRRRRRDSRHGHASPPSGIRVRARRVFFCGWPGPEEGIWEMWTAEPGAGCVRGRRRPQPQRPTATIRSAPCRTAGMAADPLREARIR
jgi:hypothetical protein